MKMVSHLTIEDVKELSKYDIFELEVKLASLIGDDNFGKDLKCGAIIDCYTNLFLFSKKQSFQANQLLWLLKTQEYLTNRCELPMEKNLDILQKSIITFQGVEDEKSIKSFIEYFLESFYQHYNLYHCMMSTEQEVVKLKKIISIESLPLQNTYPAPLEESILERLYEQYLNPKAKEKTIQKESPEEEAYETTSSFVEDGSSSPKDINTLLSSIDPENLKKLIQEVAEKRFSSLKSEMESKIGDREQAMNKTFSRLQAR